jgi:trans-aconitate 2-methyltransferase
MSVPVRVRPELQNIYIIMIKDWNPEFYLKFGKERIQPSIDLVSKIEFDNPESIIDIGCGPGNSTQVLVERWPKSKIVGIDNSSSMIEKAKKDYPNQEWQLIDASSDELKGKYDIIFSNSTIQWIPNHTKLLKKFYDSLSDKGIIAIQIPMFWDMPIGKSIFDIAREHRWYAIMRGSSDTFTMYDYSFYYNTLSELCSSVEIWQTDYFHVMDSHLSIYQMIESTAMRAYLGKLENDSDKKDFVNQVIEEIKINYPSQNDGKVLFPFKRLFFIAKK